MAIDTRNKRSSAINPQCPWRGQWPAPDSTIDQADRQHSLWSYAGILATGLVVATEGIDYALGSLQLEYALPRLHDCTESNDNPEFAL
jgi:hypothetical protein